MVRNNKSFIGEEAFWGDKVLVVSHFLALWVLCLDRLDVLLGGVVLPG